jgi:putative tricarboxylic transport membrane protein
VTAAGAPERAAPATRYDGRAALRRALFFPSANTESAMTRIDPVELFSGLLILGIGAFFFHGAAEYPMGSVSRMGPGYVPRALGAICMVLGLVIATGAVRMPGRLPYVSWRAIFTILGAIALFGLLLERVGLIGAVLVASAVSMLGNPDAGARGIALTSIILAVFCWVLFGLVLGLPFHAFRWEF